MVSDEGKWQNSPAVEIFIILKGFRVFNHKQIYKIGNKF